VANIYKELQQLLGGQNEISTNNGQKKGKRERPRIAAVKEGKQVVD